MPVVRLHVHVSRATLSVHTRVCSVHDPYTNSRAALIDAHRVVLNMAWNANPDSGYNAFSNDGSFLEQFRKMQEQQKQQASSSKSEGVLKTMTKPLGTVSMKFGAVKKGEEVSRLKPAAAGVRKMFGGDSSDSEEEGEKRRRKGVGFVCDCSCT